jgi:hypothetical protein
MVTDTKKYVGVNNIVYTVTASREGGVNLDFAFLAFEHSMREGLLIELKEDASSNTDRQGEDISSIPDDSQSDVGS